MTSSLDILGLEGVRALAAGETWARTTIRAEMAETPTCDKCGHVDQVTWWERWNTVTVADTPLRGRPAHILFEQDRFRCRRCKRDWIGRPPSFCPGQRQMTRRLARHIEDQVLRVPREHVAAATGIGPDAVDELANGLMDRLYERHRFPTPRVLGIDDLHLKKRIHIVFTDAERGHAIGIVEKSDKDSVARWLAANICADEVEVLVSDLHGLNITTARKSLPRALHIADRWHVQRAAQKALRRLLRHELGQIGAQAAKAEPDKSKRETTAFGARAANIRRNWDALIGRRPKQRVVAGQFPNMDLLGPILEQHVTISKAFYCRMALNDMYASVDVETARAHLDRFLRLAADEAIAARMSEARDLIEANAEIVLNYFRSFKTVPHGGVAGHTAGGIERRNQYIREAWRGGRGIAKLRHLSMLALYQPWHLDTDIVECGDPGCGRIEGPVSLIPGLRGQDPAQSPLPASAFRCVEHAALAADDRREAGAPEPGPAPGRPLVRTRTRTGRSIDVDQRALANDRDFLQPASAV